MNRWGIPSWLENEVRSRDKKCIYCGIEMIETNASNGSRCSWATWEHINNDISVVTRENIALCCGACNSSKGNRSLSAWIQSPYCKNRNINQDTVAEIVKEALKNA